MEKYRKAIVAFVTFLAAAIAEGLIPEPYATWIMLAIGALGVYGVYQIPNAPQDQDVFYGGPEGQGPGGGG